MNKTILVTGLPRSGTTIITKILKAIGVNMICDIGLTGDNWCPNGYDENKTVYEINKDVYRQAHYNKYKKNNVGDAQVFYEQYSISDEERDIAFKQIKASDMIKEYTKDKKGIWGFKNPNCSYLIKQWSEHLENPCIIITTRDIIETSYAHYNIWKQVEKLEDAIRNSCDIMTSISSALYEIKCPVIFIKFEDVKKSPVKAGMKLADVLKTNIPEDFKNIIDKEIISGYTTMKMNGVIFNRDNL